MPEVPHLEKLFIKGSAGRLEAIYEHSAQQSPVGGVVVCHPHPQYGGTMDNKVVHTLARAFTRMGFAALRFNFRGTGLSDGNYDDGNGEIDDVLVAIDWLQSAEVRPPVWVAGFSFGAAMAIKAAIVTRVDGLISVAPAVQRFASGIDSLPTCPWLIVQGDQDEIVDTDDTIKWLNDLRPGPELSIISGAEHFFHGKLMELRKVVTAFVEVQRA